MFEDAPGAEARVFAAGRPCQIAEGLQAVAGVNQIDPVANLEPHCLPVLGDLGLDKRAARPDAPNLEVVQHCRHWGQALTSEHLGWFRVSPRIERPRRVTRGAPPRNVQKSKSDPSPASPP